MNAQPVYLAIFEWADRAFIEEAIEALIGLLDQRDGDPDLEPALAAPEPYSWHGQLRWATGGTDDRENGECADCDGENVIPFDPRKGIALTARGR